MRVRKKSGKPFKSGQKVNTVANEVANPYTDKPGYSFIEDDSIVNQEVCLKIYTCIFDDIRDFFRKIIHRR